MPGTFEIYEDKGGKHRFRLKSSSSRVVAVGEAFPTRREAIAATDEVRRAAAGAPVPVGRADALDDDLFILPRVDEPEPPKRKQWFVHTASPDDRIVDIRAERWEYGPDGSGAVFINGTDEVAVFRSGYVLAVIAAAAYESA